MLSTRNSDVAATDWELILESLDEIYCPRCEVDVPWLYDRASLHEHLLQFHPKEDSDANYCFEEEADRVLERTIRCAHYIKEDNDY